MARNLRFRVGCLVITAAASLLSASGANARTTANAAYTLTQAYSAALRYLRVDLDLEVTEKDPDAAYLLFEYRPANDPKRAVPASIELVSSQGVVRMVVNVSKLPAYHEQWLRDGLLRKLKDDYGDPQESHPKPGKLPPEPRQKPGSKSKDKTREPLPTPAS